MGKYLTFLFQVSGFNNKLDPKLFSKKLGLWKRRENEDGENVVLPSSTGF